MLDRYWLRGGQTSDQYLHCSVPRDVYGSPRIRHKYSYIVGYCLCIMQYENYTNNLHDGGSRYQLVGKQAIELFFATVSSTWISRYAI